MKLIRLLSLLVLFLIILAVAWGWWNWPRRVDMSQYAPADSLIYFEANDLQAIVKSLTETETWKKVGPSVGLTPVITDHWWSRIAFLGIGPAEGVMFSRAQVAVVMVGLDSSEEDTVLKIRPEGAIIIESHTSNWRIKPIVENSLARFAKSAYGSVTPTRYREEAEYLEWASPSGDRKIVAAIDGSLVVVGNSKRAVQSCLETRNGQRATLRADPALHAMRARVGASQGLTFGYISAGNAARLFSWSAPMIFGRGPGDSTLEQILDRATRLLGAIGWSSRPAPGGIEDRFFFNLESRITSRLQPVFKVGPFSGSLWQVIPADVDSISIYRSEDPSRAWEALRAVSGQFDTLAAVVFGSLLKNALRPYGIEEPDAFLKAVGPDIATIKLQRGTGATVLFARVRDRLTLERMFKGQTVQNREVESDTPVRQLEVSKKDFAVAFMDDYFLIGVPDDVRVCLVARKSGATLASNKELPALSIFAPDPSSAIVTYVTDAERIHNFFAALSALNDRASSRPASRIESSQALANGANLPYAVTETHLVDDGIERRTRSAFGQFSTLIALLRRN